jgi:Uma2 family endonuclease
MPGLNFPPAPPRPTPLREEIPPLENGDHLDGDEFMRRYENMPDVKAELINGIVYMASPVRHREHANPHHILATWLGVYCSKHPQLEGGNDGTVLLGPRNKPQPDLYLMLPPDRGGRARIGDDGFIHGPPELVVEIAASTAKVDAHDKADTYRKAGVAEYLLWRTEDEAIDWFLLDGDRYVAAEPDDADRLRGRTFDGLVLDRPAVLRRDLAGVLAALNG